MEDKNCPCVHNTDEQVLQNWDKMKKKEMRDEEKKNLNWMKWALEDLKSEHSF